MSWQMENRYKTMAAGKFDFGVVSSSVLLRSAAMGGRRWDTSSLVARLER